jgi:hypothetical protein
LLLVRPPVQTAGDGRFTLASERVLTVVRPAGWSEVSLCFTRTGFQTVQTNCSAHLATNALPGEPVLDVGQILLTKQKTGPP